MGSLFTSACFTASKGSARFVSGLALLLLAATPAPAREQADGWIELLADPQGQIHVERDTIQRHGGVVYSWLTYTPRKREKSPTENRRYDYELHGRIDDCTAGTYATEVIAYRRYNGEDVELHRADGANLKFDRRVPGSLGDHVAEAVCRLGGHAENLESGVLLDDVQESDWSRLGADSTGGLTFWMLTPSAYREAGAASIIVREDYAGPQVRPDGRGYTRIVQHAIFGCEDQTYVVLSSDYYNAAGLLVAADYRAPDTAPVRKASDPGLAQVAKAACSAPALPHTGTGWLAGRGYIITASHVVGDLTEVDVFQEGRRLGAAQVVRSDPANDVAVLKPMFDTSRHAALRVSAAGPALGQRVFTLGYPLADELGVGAVKMTAGDVSSLAGVDVATGRADDHRYLQVSIPVQSGNSGGPVIGPDGSVVGLIVGKQEMSADQEIVQNVNFALKSAYINGVIEGLPALGRAKVSAARGDTATVVAGVQSGVFLIVAAPKREQTAAR